jgi:hypothetical protein
MLLKCCILLVSGAHPRATLGVQLTRDRVQQFSNIGLVL